MINDENILRTHKERIELHRRSFDDKSYRTNQSDETSNSPFAFQTVICIFIFAFILVLKLTNATLSDKFTNTLSAHLEVDNSSQIISFIESSTNQTFAFTNTSNEVDTNSEDDLKEIKLNDETVNIPSTEFTIDENMLDDITKDDSLNGKK